MRPLPDMLTTFAATPKRRRQFGTVPQRRTTLAHLRARQRAFITKEREGLRLVRAMIRGLGND